MKLYSKAGQIAIFVILIFQVLFILFSMAINVALVAHDKINLQSSLDMATLYGAQKQAEVLNAISHINFQMRQNYKLLSWRYRILGTVAHRHNISPGDVFCPPVRNSIGANHCLQATSQGKAIQESYPGFYDRYFICASVPLWTVGRVKNNGFEDGYVGEDRTSYHCQNKDFRIPEIPIPSISPVIPGSGSFASETRRVKRFFEASCAANSALNARIAHFFLTHFRLDQRDRRLMMEAIFNKTLKVGRDMDGKSIREGMMKTFKKNLTYANLKNFKDSNPESLFKVFNSFKGKKLGDFLKPIRIFTILGYLVTDERCSGSIHWTMEKGDNSKVFAKGEDSSEFNTFFNGYVELNQHIPSDPHPALNNLVVGFEPVGKDVLYYGASVEIPYGKVSPLFSPFIGSKESFSMTASSFSKPFGGKLGPPKEADPLLKNLIEAGEGRAGGKLLPYLYQPNYSLFPGDTLGLVRKMYHLQYYLKKQKRFSPEAPFFYNAAHYIHLFPSKGGSSSGAPLPPDALANDLRKEVPDGSPLLSPRLMELTAIAPDVFDMTYYSIFNNYMETYFPKICKLIGSSQSECDPNKREMIQRSATDNREGFIRGDFGYPYTDTYRRANLEEHKSPTSLSPFFFHFKNLKEMNLSGQESLFYYSHRAPYLIRDPAHTLTSWSPTTQKNRYANYVFPKKIFMGCHSLAVGKKKATDLKFFNPSGCAQGGRSGYSVKLISCKVAETFQNRPPFFNEACK